MTEADILRFYYKCNGIDHGIVKYWGVTYALLRCDKHRDEYSGNYDSDAIDINGDIYRLYFYREAPAICTDAIKTGCNVKDDIDYVIFKRELVASL